MLSSPLDSPVLRDDLPRYPPLVQLCRVTSTTVPGPADPPKLYASYTQQVRTDTLLPRDRETCVVDDINGSGLAAGFYNCRLVGSYTATTTIASSIVGSGVAQTFTPASMAGILNGMVLLVDSGMAQEQTLITSVTGMTFTAIVANNHTGPVTVIGVCPLYEVPGGGAGSSFPSGITAGGIIDTGVFQESIPTSTTLSSTPQNNYPALTTIGFPINPTVDVSLTGIVPSGNGQLLNLINTGSKVVTIPSGSGSSTSTNRFTLSTGTTLVIPPVAGITAITYDSNLLRWVPWMPPVFEPSDPPQITLDQNDYSLSTGTEDKARINSDATRTITGIAGGWPEREIELTNDGSNNIILSDQNTSSSAINRMIIPGGLDYTLIPDSSATIKWDENVLRWRLTKTSDVARASPYGVTSWNPGGGTVNDLSSNSLLDFVSSTATTLTGVSKTGFVAGSILEIVNKGTAVLTLLHQSGSSASGNRFNLPAYASMLLQPGDGATFALSSTGSDNWTCTGRSQGVGVRFGVDLTGQTAANGAVLQYTDTGLGGTYRLGAYATITAVAIDVLTVQVTYTDETNTVRTPNFFPMGVTSANLAVTGAFQFPTMDIRVKANTQITILTALVTGGSINYDVGATIEQLR